MATPTTTPKPAMSPPPGEVSNFENPESLWKYNVIAQSFCLGIAGIVFLLRTYVRIWIKRQWILEDYMTTLSFIGLVVYSGIISTIMDNHGGVHQWNITVPQLQKILYYFWIESIVYGAFILFTKLSILLLYIRVFSPRRWSLLYCLIYSYIAISSMFYLAITLVKIWQCNPRERIWDKTLPGTCINLPGLLTTSGLFNTISDVLILLVPIKAVWNLKISKRKKAGVCLVFTIGAIAPIFSAIGFVVRLQTASSPDASWNQPLILLWGTAEVATGVICACLPMLPALFKGKRTATKPTQSIVNGSTNRGTNRGNTMRSINITRKPENGYYHNGTYLELDEDYGRKTSPQNTVVTKINGGHSPYSSQERISRSDDEEYLSHEGGIIRTVRIETGSNV